MAGYQASQAFAGPYLQDQLILPLAVAGGSVFTSVKVSEHSRTAAGIVKLFTDRGTNFEASESGATLVRVE